MKTFAEFVAENPSGLLELKSPLSFTAYSENMGFDLEKTFNIYQSSKIHHLRKEWFAFPGKSLETLVDVKQDSKGDLLVAYVVEIIKNGKVYCYMLLSNEAYKNILADVNQHILQVHQMYADFWQNHIALNLKQETAC